MSWSLQNRGTGETFFKNQNGDSRPEALRWFWALKNIRRGKMTANELRKMIMKFEKTGSLSPGRGRKHISTVAIGDGALMVEKHRASNSMGSMSLC